MEGVGTRAKGQIYRQFDEHVGLGRQRSTYIKISKSREEYGAERSGLLP